MTYYRDENGEYIRTVTCSYCWTRGHNRSSCPDRAEKIEEQRAEDPDCYSVRRYDQEKKNKKTRSCSYCGNEGHNVTTCKGIAEHLEVEIDSSIVYRAQAYEHIKESGLGIGALVRVENYYDANYNNVEAMGFVTEILWDKINHLNRNNYYGPTCFIAKMQIMGRYNSNTLELALPYHPELCYGDNGRRSSGSEFEVAVPSDRVEPPSGWFDEPSKDVVRAFRLSLREEGSYYVARRHEEEAKARDPRTSEEQAVA